MAVLRIISVPVPVALTIVLSYLSRVLTRGYFLARFHKPSRMGINDILSYSSFPGNSFISGSFTASTENNFKIKNVQVENIAENVMPTSKTQTAVAPP